MLAAAVAALRADSSTRPSPAFDAAPFEWQEKGIAELQKGMTSGKKSTARIPGRTVSRANRRDRRNRGPAINSVIEVNPEAVAK